MRNAKKIQSSSVKQSYTKFYKRLNVFIFVMIMLAGFGLATTITERSFVMTNNGNTSGVYQYAGANMRLSTLNDTFIRLVDTQPGTRSKIQWYNGTQMMLSIECHGLDDPYHQGTPETHCGFYGSNSTGSTKKIFSIQWGYDINNITLDNGNLGRSAFDFNNAPIYNANFSSARILSGGHFFRDDTTITIQDSDTSLTSAAPVLQLAESGASQTIGSHWNITTALDFSLVIRGPSGRFVTINRTTGQTELGTATAPVNLTMYSGNGTRFNCGVNNTGSFICSGF